MLFHGAKTVPPDQIYASETGLDMRFSRSGHYGQGIYFADNASYSHDFAWRENNGVFCLFVCFVLVGDSCIMNHQDGSLRLPPLKNESANKFERYDSVMNTAKGHTIIYNNSYQYPAYLLRYSL